MKSKRISLIIMILLLIGGLLPESSVLSTSLAQKLNSHTFPKLANYYLKTPISNADAIQLAKWDLVILSPQAQDRSASSIEVMRKLNPNIVILVYIPSQEFPLTDYKQWETDINGVWHTLLRGITDEMWLKGANGDFVTMWKNNWMLNVTDYTTNNKRWNEYLSDFVVEKLLSTGLWDGVFYDNTFTEISWINNGNIDIDNDGIKDSKSKIEKAWTDGMEYIFRRTRERADRKIIIVGNGDRGYYGSINGHYFENFSKDRKKLWAEKMRLFGLSSMDSQSPTSAIIGNNTVNTGRSKDYKSMRFGLASSLLEGGYYGFDFGDQDHSQLWWYDEYNIDLGQPLSSSVSKEGFETYAPDIWQRDYDNGLALVNSTPYKEYIDLNGEYEKIHGTQDPEINDGSIITDTEIDGYDGLLLLKTFSALNDVLFTNGEFARFFEQNGGRVRNGFFVFDDTYKGGDNVAHIDLDGNGKRDLLVVSKNKITAWRDDGQLYMKKYPYTINYKGKLQVALGDLNNDKKMEIYVSPEAGYPGPIKIYTRHGRQMKNDWFPFGENYTGGYSIAVGNIDKSRGNDLIIGTGQGVQPEVYLYDRFYNYTNRFLVFESYFRGGFNLTSGDVDGDSWDEVIVGAGPGKKPIIRVFDNSGTMQSEFTAYSAFGTPGIKVQTADVDFDGKDDIIGMSEGIGF